MSGAQLYVSGRAKKLRTLPELIKAETIKGVRRGQQRIKRFAAEGLRERGIGRAVFGRNLSGAYKLMRRDRVKEAGGSIRADLIIKGLASIQDIGGPIRPHKITRGKHSFIHPGVKSMPKFPYLDRAVNRARPEMEREVAKGMARVAEIVRRAA